MHKLQTVKNYKFLCLLPYIWQTGKVRLTPHDWWVLSKLRFSSRCTYRTGSDYQTNFSSLKVSRDNDLSSSSHLKVLSLWTVLKLFLWYTKTTFHFDLQASMQSLLFSSLPWWKTLISSYSFYIIQKMYPSQ